MPQLFSAPSPSAQQPTAVVTGINHFLGFHLAQALMARDISVIGIPYCLADTSPSPFPLPTSPEFQLFSLADLQSRSSTLPTTSYSPLDSSSIDQYLQQFSTSPLSQTVDYIFLTDLYAASFSSANLTTDQFSQIQQHYAHILSAFSHTSTKTNFILPYYHLHTDSSPFPFHQVDFRHFYRQILSSGLSSTVSNFRISSLVDCYGPGLPFDSPTPMSQIFSALRSKTATHLPIGGQTRLYPLHVDDAVTGIINSTFSLHTQAQQFLFSASQPITLTTLISRVKRLGTKSSRLIPAFTPPPLTSLIPSDLLNITRRRLHWQPQIDLLTGFTQTLAGNLNSPTVNATASSLAHSTYQFPDTTDPINPPTSSSLRGLRVEGLFPKPSTSLSLSKVEGLNPPPSSLRRLLPSSLSLPRLPSLLPAFIITALLLLFLPISLFGFSIVRSSLVFRQSYQSLRTGQLNQAANQAEFAHRGFQSLSRGVELINFLKYLPLISQPYDQVRTQLHLAELSSHALSQASLSLVLLQETLQSTLDSNSNRDPRVTLSHARLQLSKTQYLLALLQAQLPDQLPFYLSRSLEVGEYQHLRQLLPQGREKISQLLSALNLYDQAAGFIEPQTYMLLLQNNRELRPTGGFIGSFALFTLDRGHLANWKIYDVYSADGQLQGHVEPPLPIRDHLGEANWYLRDSNWDPDFPTTATRVQWFLNKELNEQVAGVFAIDVDFINNLVAVLGSVEIPDLDTTVTADNFYETTQHQAQANSFDGSHQKSDYLSSLTDAITYKLQHEPNLDWLQLSTAVFNGLEQKHFLLHFNQPATQTLVSAQGWDGAIASAPVGDQILGTTSDIIDDQLLIVEANLGVNKANNYVDRSLQHTVDLTTSESITETLQLKYTNNSTTQNWLGGDYKNYLRLYLPSGAQLQNILISNPDAEPLSLDEQSIDLTTEHNRSVFGFLLLVPQSSVRLVTITYTLPINFISLPQAQYRLSLVKQPGTQADPYQLTIKYPDNFKPTNTNLNDAPTGASPLPSLTDQHTLTYNTTISRDQTFNISFIKEKIKDLQ